MDVLLFVLHRSLGEGVAGFRCFSVDLPPGSSKGHYLEHTRVTPSAASVESCSYHMLHLFGYIASLMSNLSVYMMLCTSCVASHIFTCSILICSLLLPPARPPPLGLQAADSMDVARSAPFVEKLVAEGYEVLYLTEPIDEAMVANLAKFDDHDMVDVTKEGLDLGADEGKKVGEGCGRG